MEMKTIQMKYIEKCAYVDFSTTMIPIQLVQMFAIHVLMLTSNSRNDHIHKVQACAHEDHTYCNSVDIFVRICLCL